MSKIEQRSKQWHEQRKLRITGSRVGAILGLSPWQKPADVMRAMVREYHGAESEFKGGPHIDHGVNARRWANTRELTDGRMCRFMTKTNWHT